MKGFNHYQRNEFCNIKIAFSCHRIRIQAELDVTIRRFAGLLKYFFPK